MNKDGEARPPGADRWVEALTWYGTLRKRGEGSHQRACSRVATLVCGR